MNGISCLGVNHYECAWLQFPVWDKAFESLDSVSLILESRTYQRRWDASSLMSSLTKKAKRSLLLFGEKILMCWQKAAKKWEFTFTWKWAIKIHARSCSLLQDTNKTTVLSHSWYFLLLCSGPAPLYILGCHICGSYMMWSKCHSPYLFL